MKSKFFIRYHHDIVTIPVKINISVVQDRDVLYNRVLDLQCYLSPLLIEFEFQKLSPIKLTFKTDYDQIRNSPLYIDRIELDGLLDMPFIAHSGFLETKDHNTNTGNCLYTTGQLSYNFLLPLCNNCEIIQ